MNRNPTSRAARSEKMVQEDNIDVHVGGFLSNICIACMPLWQEAKILNMITRLPRHHADHQQVQPLHLPPA